MSDYNTNITKKVISVLLASVLLVLSVLPGFSLIGNLFSQIIITIFLSIIILIILDYVFKVNTETVSHALIIMNVFWVFYAVILQIKRHIDTGDFSFKWLYLFYYDKPALIFVIIFVAVLYYVIRLINKKDDVAYINSYKIFIRNIVWCLLVYYALILFYCFYLVREITFERPEPNMIPFAVINFSINTIDYELLFLLLGNIAIFFPLGVIISSINKNKVLNALLPVFISVGIEISQYFLGNGHPDIDDVMLNVLGYYLGIIVRFILDRVVYFASGKQFKSFIFFK